LAANVIADATQKFDVPNEILGYAMESFSAGRAETKIRHVEVPVAPLDFMSEYPTVAALMDLMEILRAKKLTFEDATNEVQSLIESMSLHRCFKGRQWRDFRFFALVEPSGDVFPVRTMHNRVRSIPFLTLASPPLIRDKNRMR
jgi:hypothetical protein